MDIKKLIILFSLSVVLFSQERMRLNEIQGSPTFVEDKQEFKTSFFPYLSLPIPSVGTSYRWDGQSVDLSVGILGIDCVYSRIRYFKETSIGSVSQGFYSSMGLGAGVGLFGFDRWSTYVHVIPKLIIPIRVGYEGRIGFVDLGIQIIYFPERRGMNIPLPMPEIRGGISF